MKIRNILTVLLCFIFTIAQSQTINIDEARSRAERFVKGQFPASRATSSTTYTSVKISDYLYVFNLSTGGWVIVSADKNNDEILGYNLSGHFDENIPDNVSNVIKGYEKQIKKEIANPTPKSRAAIAEPVKKAPIEPLCKTQWNQTHPYNLLCPEENGKKCYTGCVPTAMAQLMAYYKWPDKGHGERYGDGIWSDEGAFIGYTDTLRIDEIPLDWDNMCNSYYGGETQAQQIAVATLMRLCGETCGVSYHSSSSGSGANGYAPYEALMRYFYYKGELLEVAGSGDVGLHDYMYNALSQKKPIICYGKPNTDPRSLPHEYICDGYDGKGYFHFNWGWGGSKHGFYKLKGAVYFVDNTIIMEPDYDKTWVADPTIYGCCRVWGSNGWKYEGKNDETDWIDFGVDFTHSVRQKLQVGLKIVSPKDENKYTLVFECDEEGFVPNYSIYSKPYNIKKFLYPFNFSDGEYKCYLVYRKDDNDEWHDMKFFYIWDPTYIRMLVENGEITLLSPNPADISVSVKPDRIICVSGVGTSHNINIYNTYGMRVYSGRDEEIKVASSGIYTVVVGDDFRKTIGVK